MLFFFIYVVFSPQIKRPHSILIWIDFSGMICYNIFNGILPPGKHLPLFIRSWKKRGGCFFGLYYNKESRLEKAANYFTRTEIILWSVSVVLIISSFLIFDRGNYLTLAASLIGVTALIFNAKGNPIGQALMIVFSILYGIISFSFAYYGEMITYLGMSMPMAIVSLISWIKTHIRAIKERFG